MTDRPWDKLAGASTRAAERGDSVRARELGGAARDAWLRHCEAVEAEIKARSKMPARSIWLRDWERER